jgi:IPT/TIG domain-containing protein
MTKRTFGSRPAAAGTTKHLAPLMSLAMVLSACDGAATSPTSPSATIPSTRPAPPTLPAPSVTSLSLNAGSTGGSTPLRIVGTGLLTGATVSFGSIRVMTRTDHRYPGTDLFLDTPPHDSGTVDITVTNLDGQSVRVTDAYTYVVPDELDCNGTWDGYALDGQDLGIGFVIRDDALVSAYCDDTSLRFSPPVPVTRGAFFAVDAEGRTIEGRIVSAKDAVGTSNLPPCNRGSAWIASKHAP